MRWTIAHNNQVALLVIHMTIGLYEQPQVFLPGDPTDVEQNNFSLRVSSFAQPPGADVLISRAWPKEGGVDATRPDAYVLKALFSQHHSRRRRWTKGQRALTVNKTIVGPHRLR